jgi:hypothetical protein
VEGVDTPTAAESIVITIRRLNSNQPQLAFRVMWVVFFTEYFLSMQVKFSIWIHPFQLTLDMELETSLSGNTASNAFTITATNWKILPGSGLKKG